MWYQITLAIGIALLLLSIFFMYRSVSFLKASKRAHGKVVELETVYTGSKQEITFRPIFSFITDDGSEIIYDKAQSSNPASWEIGEEATYAYMPENKQKGSIVSYFEIFLWSIILSCLSMPLILVGGGYYLAQMYLK